MKINKTKRFQNWRFYYSINYNQFEYPIHDGDGNETGKFALLHQETSRYIGWPDLFGTVIKVGRCDDTADYYRQ
jgi:hypothetical protein